MESARFSECGTDMPPDAKSPPPKPSKLETGFQQARIRSQGLPAEGVAELTLRLPVPGRFGELLGAPIPLTPDRKVRLGR